MWNKRLLSKRRDSNWCPRLQLKTGKWCIKVFLVVARLGILPCLCCCKHFTDLTFSESANAEQFLISRFSEKVLLAAAGFELVTSQSWAARINHSTTTTTALKSNLFCFSVSWSGLLARLKGCLGRWASAASPRSARPWGSSWRRPWPSRQSRAAWGRRPCSPFPATRRGRPSRLGPGCRCTSARCTAGCASSKSEGKKQALSRETRDLSDREEPFTVTVEFNLVRFSSTRSVGHWNVQRYPF